MLKLDSVLPLSQAKRSAPVILIVVKCSHDVEELILQRLSYKPLGIINI